MFNKTNQIPGEPEIVIHFATLSSPLHAKIKKLKKIPQDRHLKREMVAYVEKNLCRIKIFTKKLFLRYKFESHCGI